MAEREDGLHRLAQAHGIALDYHDIWGRLHRVDDEALRMLLGAMHVPARTNEEVEAALRTLDDAQWLRPMAPLSVVRTHVRPWVLRVRIPRPRDAAGLAWRLTGETGEVRHHAIERQRIATTADVDRDGAPHVALDIELAFDLAPGYYRVALLVDDEAVAEADLAVAPPACYRPAALASGARAWGAAVQLYGVRSAHDWGLGDFGSLGELAATWGEAGADVIGVNPLHALFPHDPARASPYSPSSRLFVNPLYIDVGALPEFRWSAKARTLVASAAFREMLDALRASPLVRHAEVAAAKHRVLEIVFADARRSRHARARERWTQFETYKATGGEALRRHARFEALQEHLHRADPDVWGWPAWPEAYRDPGSAAVQRFADEHAERVDYFAWLQWQAAQQRAEAAARARNAGMTVGLYTDLAVSVDRGGAETWSRQELYGVAASVGAPPDAFNVNGQDWGLPPMVPSRLAASGYAPFIATLRATMRDAGALRIDHVMVLYRLFWVPQGEKPARGAYVRYPFDDLLGLLALESHRHRCAVIGEDLGTVPDEVRHALAANDILSYRVLMFERDEAGAFKAPSAYPEPALATATTHDLPTLAGWWEGHDIGLRAAHGMLGEQPDVEREQRQRADERTRLVTALVREGVLDEREAQAAVQAPLAPAVALAVQRYLGRSAAVLMVVQPEDVLGVREPANLPGTTDQHPNWRRRLPATVDEMANDGRFSDLASALRAERPRTAVPAAAQSRKRAFPAPARRPPAPVPLPAAAIPGSTYRLQLHREFTFRDVEALVPYFAALGVTHLYLSPYLRARPGSRHGYDVVDHAALNPEIGTGDDFERMVAALARHGMQHVCDVVPNHMAILGADNAWWMDVLQHGPASAYALHFDIDWHPPDASLHGKVLVPVLGQPYGTALEQGELRLVFEAEAGTFAVRYYDHRLPIDPRTYPDALARLGDVPGATEDVAALRALAEAWRALPARDDFHEARKTERRERAGALSAELARLVAR
ncbi:MAG TPA: 4-alpha-glucanotransferase, partial [Casimicrobiaceae bacterium]|nr:4-alpha-glucanotransferase [Casimicrobiaceae bacterium]